MAEDSDIKDLKGQIDSIWDAVGTNFREGVKTMAALFDEANRLDKVYGEKSKAAEKEIADLKARVKELETKLGKMGKK
jgi:hypothetical protein